MRCRSQFILLIFGYFVWLTLCTADRGSYGDNCNRTNRCDSQSSLSCIDNKCLCLKPMEMIYDENVKKCRILSGEKCSFTVIDSRTDGTDTFGETRVTEIFDCVENATCMNEFCTCLPDWYEDSGGICRSKKGNGKKCNSNNECREDLNLKCENEVCSCDPNEAVFNRNQCVAKVGVSCQKYRICVTNAECGRYGICTCRREYEESKNNEFCLGRYGANCDTDISPCIQPFSCVDGQCVCQFSQHQLYDSIMGQCVSYPQGPCIEYVNGSVLKFPCIPNAECKTRDNISECTCSDGYIHSVNRQCLLAHGQPCFESKLCDQLPNLVCRNGRCECQDLQFYDETRSLCIGLVGAQCLINDNFCHDGASCQSNRFNFRDWSSMNKYSTDGTCRCSGTHESNSARKRVRRENVIRDIDIEDIVIEGE